MSVFKFSIAADHPCLSGHFPGRPIVPGVVILEQVLCAVAKHAGHEVVANTLPQVKFVQPLLPGQLATIALQRRDQLWQFDIRVETAMVATGSLVTSSA